MTIDHITAPTSASDRQREFEAVVARLKSYPLRPPFERPARYAMLLRGWSAAQLHALIDDCVSRRVPPRVLREHLCRARAGELVPEEFSVALRAVPDPDVPAIVRLRKLLKRAGRDYGLRCVSVTTAGTEIDLGTPLPVTEPADSGPGGAWHGAAPQPEAVQPEAPGCGAAEGAPAGQNQPAAAAEIGGGLGEMRAIGNGELGAHRSENVPNSNPHVV